MIHGWRSLTWTYVILWAGLAAESVWLKKIEPPFWAAAIAATVTSGVALAARFQSKRAATLELHKEYYSHDFAEDRRTAERFFQRYPRDQWDVSPYKFPDPDDTLRGYSQVLRFWHRVAVLYKNYAIDRSLTEKLLSREFAYWWALIFIKMNIRDDMYTWDLLNDLSSSLLIGEGSDSYKQGFNEGRKRYKPAPQFKWVWGGKRWTTKGRAAVKSKDSTNT